MEQCKKKNINDVALGIINGRVQSTAQVHANVNTNLQVRDQLGGWTFIINVIVSPKEEHHNPAHDFVQVIYDIVLQQ
jgi:hypothetical protein